MTAAKKGAKTPAKKSAASKSSEASETTFSVDALPEGLAEAQEYRKIAATRALRIDGPFVVETSEGPLKCADGYVALDARGYPYPIAVDEFAQIYVPITESPDADAKVAAGLSGSTPDAPAAEVATRLTAPRSWWISSDLHVDHWSWVATDADGKVAYGEKPTEHEARAAATTFAYRRVDGD